MKETTHTLNIAGHTFPYGHIGAAVAALTSWLRVNMTRILWGSVVMVLLLLLLALYLLALTQATESLRDIWVPWGP